MKEAPLSSDWPRWQRLAEGTVRRTAARLPGHLREHAGRLTVVYDTVPGPELLADEVSGDTLGLFVGEAYPDSLQGGDVIPNQIILFLDNLRDLAEGDEAVFCEEVEVTYLHELGHYLGLDEQDLADRDLD